MNNRRIYSITKQEIDLLGFGDVAKKPIKIMYGLTKQEVDDFYNNLSTSEELYYYVTRYSEELEKMTKKGYHEWVGLPDEVGEVPMEDWWQWGDVEHNKYIQLQLAKAVISTWNRPFIDNEWTEARCVHCNGYIEIFKKDWPTDWGQGKISVLLKRCLLHKDDCIVLEAEKVIKGE